MKRLSLFFILTVVIVALLLVSSSISFTNAGKDSEVVPASFKAIFGSCNKHDHDQTYWNNLAKRLGATEDEKIDVINWLGDIVYQDYMTVPVWGHFTQYNESEMKNRWQFMKERKEYQSILKKTKHVVGIYDDHDMGRNDEGKECKVKKFNQQNLLDFLDVPSLGSAQADKAATVRRNRDGVYAFHKFPINNVPASSKDSMNICFLMLDGRTHRDPPHINKKADVLGEAQWKWLEKVLREGRDPEIEESPLNKNIRNIDDVCVATFISHGVQIIADAWPGEGWGEFLEARNRLLSLLQRSGATKFTILSGDVHFAEANMLSAEKIPLAKDQEEEKPYNKCGESPFEYQNLYEVTSSGLTHHLHPLFENKQNFESWFPSHRRTAPGMYPRENAGLIEVSCRKPADPRSCEITISFVALPDATQEVTQVKINFALDSAEIQRRKEALPAAEIKMCREMMDYEGKNNKYVLPAYYMGWTWYLMKTKEYIPGLEEEGRLYLMMYHLWFILIVIGIVVKLMCRCCCGGGGGNKKKQKTE